jgi:hypothetical protein
MTASLKLATRTAGVLAGALLVIAVSIGSFGAGTPDDAHTHRIAADWGRTLYLSDFQWRLGSICLWGAAGALIVAGILKAAERKR